jgi:hypothetical protein
MILLPESINQNNNYPGLNLETRIGYPITVTKMAQIIANIQKADKFTPDQIGKINKSKM